MTAYNQKEIFTCNGTIQKVVTPEGKERHTFMPTSQKYLHDNLNRLPLGKPVQATFSEHAATRSGQQLKYHMVLMGYLGEYVGLSREDMHSVIMIEVFGTRKVKWRNIVHEVRYSLSDAAKFPKDKMMMLIDHDLKICAEFEVRVPSMQELGYV